MSGIDVDRLYRAMCIVDNDYPGAFNIVAISEPETQPVAEALAAVYAALDARASVCWFCKGEFPVDALIAGYDTFEEQRLACLACNERMSGNWKPA